MGDNYSCISLAEGKEGVERKAGEWFSDRGNGGISLRVELVWGEE